MQSELKIFLKALFQVVSDKLVYWVVHAGFGPQLLLFCCLVLLTCKFWEQCCVNVLCIRSVISFHCVNVTLSSHKVFGGPFMLKLWHIQYHLVCYSMVGICVLGESVFVYVYVTMHLYVCLYINLYYVPCILNLCIVCYSWLASHSKVNKKIGAWRTFVIRAITIYWDHIHVYMKLQYCSYCLTVVSQDGHLYEINIMRLIWRETLLQTQ